MEALITAITLGSIWYFILTIGWIILLIYLVENDSIYLSGSCIIIYILFLNFIVKKDIIGYITQNPGKTSVIIFGYFFVGFIWSFIKWWLFVNRKVIEYKHRRQDWLLEEADIITSKTGDVPNELKKIDLDTEIPEYLVEKWSSAYKIEKPSVYLHKQRIANWIIYWPFSAFWSIIEDFIGKIMKIIVIKVRFIYEAITERAFKNTSDIDWK